MKKIVCTHYEVKSNRIPEAFNNCKIAMLSDMHDNVYGIDLNRLYDMIDEQNPDLIIFAGDLLTRKKSDGSDSVLNLVARLTKKYPLYYANGNHESKVNLYRDKYGDAYDLFIEELKSIGVTVLNNDSITYEKEGQSINIFGLEIGVDYFNVVKRPKMMDDYIPGLIGEAKEGYNLLIAHNPMFFEHYAKWGADLVFSGHIHGGIIRIPGLGGFINPDYRLFPKYDAGQFKMGDSTMILGRGLGTHTINIRINNPPELVVATLVRN